MTPQRAASARLAVCAPVRNEASLLPGFLEALAAQRDVDPFTLCLLLNGCTDASAQIVSMRAPQLPFSVAIRETPGGPPNAGLARRQAMALGLEVLDSGHDPIIISTDADSVPAPDWLVTNISGLKVSDVVAGRIIRAPDSPSPLQDRVEAYLDSVFALRRRIDPVPWEAPCTHHCASGASLGFRAQVYRALGGFDPIPSSEDARLVDAAHRAGLRVRRDSAVRVTTSARRIGRAAGGLADHLRKIDLGATVPMMAHPDGVIWRYAREAAARVAWSGTHADRIALARLFGADVDHVSAIAANAVNDEAFAS